MAVVTTAPHFTSSCTSLPYCNSPRLVQSSVTNPPSLLYLPPKSRGSGPIASISMSVDMDKTRSTSPSFGRVSDNKTSYSSVSVAELNVFNPADSPIMQDSPPETPTPSPRLMEKRDSGFAETESLISDHSPPSTSSSSKPRHHRRKSSKAPSQETSTSTSTSRPTLSRHSSSSTATRPGNSRKNSFLLHRSNNVNNIPSASIPPRRSSANKSSGRCRKDMISFHQHSCRLFQSLGGALAYDVDPSQMPDESSEKKSLVSRPHLDSSQRTVSTSSYSHPSISKTLVSRSCSMPSPVVSDPATSTTPSLTSSPTSTTTSSPNLDSRNFDPSSSHQQRPIPTTVMSWTSTASRRAEFAKIDAEHSGLRGVWKRCVPKWMRGRACRVGFYDGGGGAEDGDGGSVRRFRMDL